MGVSKIAESLPNITGYISETCSGANGVLPKFSGVFSVSGTGTMLVTGTSGVYVNNATINFSASKSSSVYKNNGKVRPLSYQVLYCLKY